MGRRAQVIAAVAFVLLVVGGVVWIFASASREPDTPAPPRAQAPRPVSRDAPARTPRTPLASVHPSGEAPAPVPTPSPGPTRSPSPSPSPAPAPAPAPEPEPDPEAASTPEPAPSGPGAGVVDPAGVVLEAEPAPAVTVVDGSGRPVVGAVSRVVRGAGGSFLVVEAPGFASRIVPLERANDAAIELSAGGRIVVEGVSRAWVKVVDAPARLPVIDEPLPDDGVLKTRPLAAGPYVVGLTWDDCVATAEVVVADDRETRVTFVHPRGGSIQGRLDVGPHAGPDALERVELEVAASAARFSIRRSPAPDGAYRFDGLAPGPWRLSALNRRGGRLGDPVDVIVEREREVRVDLILPTGVVRGRVVHADGRPAAGITVEAVSAEAAVYSSFGHTQADGAFLIFGLRDGVYRVVASLSGAGASAPQTVSVAGGIGPPALDLRLGGP